MSDPSPVIVHRDDTPDSLSDLIGQVVVVDTDAHYVYLGLLASADRHFIRVDNVDVHELTKSSLSKERYVHEAHSIGVRPNRKSTWIRMDRVVSISRLDDIDSFKA